MLQMKYNMPERVYHDICRFAIQDGIDRVILFGSRARGTHAERSDIDLAATGGDFDRFYFDVQEQAHSLLMFDIVNLDETVSDEMQQEIEKDGVIIYEKIR